MGAWGGGGGGLLLLLLLPPSLTRAEDGWLRREELGPVSARQPTGVVPGPVRPVWLAGGDAALGRRRGVVYTYSATHSVLFQWQWYARAPLCAGVRGAPPGGMLGGARCASVAFRASAPAGPAGSTLLVPGHVTTTRLSKAHRGRATGAGGRAVR